MTAKHGGGDGRSLAEQVQHLREDVDLLLATRHDATRSMATPARNWQTMSVTDAAAAWTALTDWVDHLVDRYALDEIIPVCWYAHGAMVEELHALHIAWLAAYAGRSTAPTADRALWHELLDRARARIREWDRHGCTGGTHRPDDPLGATEAQLTARAKFVHADLQKRARRDGAAPPDEQ